MNVRKRLRELKFTAADIETLAANGDSPETVLQLCERLIDMGAATESTIRAAYEEQYPEVFQRKELSDSIFTCIRPLSDFDEQEAEWLVDGWIPKGQITTLASDGGIGKTTLWCDLVAAISSGRKCFLDSDGVKREPALCMFLSSEDSTRKKLRRKLREAGADLRFIITPDFANDPDGLQRKLKFGTYELESLIRCYAPSICVFDPLQGFVPPDINMGSRNAMRDCMAPLISLGEETGTTFLVICHTNKRRGAFGRDRIADSADLWDVSRSVLMAGYTGEQGIRFLSHEKSNYGQLMETKLFSIDANGQIVDEGRTWKRDREFQTEASQSTKRSSRQDCKEWILQQLEANSGEMATKLLDDAAKAEGYSFRTLRRAKDELKTSSDIRYFQLGAGTEKVWYIQRISIPEEWSSDHCTPSGIPDGQMT